MNVLLTGGTGFVGRRLIELLAGRGDRIAAIVRPTSSWQSGRAGVRTLVHDGTTASMVDLVKAERPDVVVHLASRFLVQHGPDDVESLVAGNIQLGLQLLEAMRLANVRRLVCAGTFWQHYETDGYRPVNLYAATKQAFQDLAAYYVDAEGFAISHLHLFDVYGPGDTRPKLMQHLLTCARSGQSLQMTPGEQLLDLVHVDDVASAFVAAIDRQGSGEAHGAEIFAVSSGAPLSLQALVKLLGNVTGSPLPVTFGGRPYRSREVMRPWRAGVGIPGWRPRVSLEDGLRGLLAANV